MITYNNDSMFWDSDTNIIYSCDMLRIVGKIDYNKRQSFIEFMNNPYSVIPSREYPESVTELRYRYMWDFTLTHTKIAVGFWFNALQDIPAHTLDFFVEFNPNKIKPFEFVVVDNILSFSSSSEVRRLDLAIDLPYPRNSVHLIRDRRSYKLEEWRTRTDYLGVRNEHGYVKLYDKSYESKLDYPLTRLEITTVPFLTEFSKIVPTVRVDVYQRSLCDVSALRGVTRQYVLLLRQLDFETAKNSLAQIDRHERKKLEPYVFADTDVLTLNQKFVNSVFAWCKNCCATKHFTTDSV